jgi:hypothetical protein
MPLHEPSHSLIENAGEALASLQHAVTEESSEFKAIVIVKNNRQEYTVNNATTVGQLISMIVTRYNEGLEERQLQESQIILLFSGRKLTNLDQVISEIPNYEKGVSTFLCVLRNVGGDGTKKIRYHRRSGGKTQRKKGNNRGKNKTIKERKYVKKGKKTRGIYH